MSSGQLQITLLADEWNSTKGGLSTVNRGLAIELAKHPNVAVTFFVPKCSEQDRKAAGKHNIRIVEATERTGYDPLDWLSFPPGDLVTDVIIGHGVKLGKQAQVIKDCHDCSCWLQVVHTVPEELAMFKNYSGAISKGDEKQWAEVKLCKIADFVLAVGPKLQEFYSANLSSCGKNVINLTPGIFTELSDLELSTQGAKKFRVLVFGRGDSEDFELKGFDIAARAVAELNDKSYQLIFVGAPTGNEDQVAKKLLEQGLNPSQLTVKGYLKNRDDLATLLSTANLAVIPSRTEGFGLTALEALSAGLPFLVCQNSGFGEALQEIPLGSTWIVDSEDPKKWAEAIKGVRKKGRESALKECQELRTCYAAKYSWEKQCNHLVEMMLTFVTDRNKGKCLSSDDSNDGRDPATQGRGFLRAMSWPSGDETDGEKLVPGRDGRSLINRSVSHEPNPKKSKERKTSTRKGFINFVSKIKTKRRKKSSDPSNNEENSFAVESTAESSSETLVAASNTAASSSPQSCENLSPVSVPEVLTDSLSAGESVTWPISLGYESGFMSMEDPSVSSEKTIFFIHCFDLEGKAFKEEVLKLYDRFGQHWGYNCHLDKLETIQVAENKFRYVLNSVKKSDFVFICVSPGLKRIFDSSQKEISNSLGDDEQTMLRLAADMILAEIALDASNRKGKFMTIMVKGSSTNDVPYFMNSYWNYQWPKDEGKIRCVIEGKPEIAPACVGDITTLPG